MGWFGWRSEAQPKVGLRTKSGMKPHRVRHDFWVKSGTRWRFKHIIIKAGSKFNL